MAPTKPTLELLRSLSDEHVLRALMAQRQATRAEIAAATGLSKPTVSESVRRLSAAGAVVDTGERTTGRGRVGTYYALPATTGCALVASLAPEGIVAEAIDVYGDVVARAQAPVTRSPGAGQVARTLQRVAGEVGDGPFRLAVVSAADPVDRETGRLVELPDAPFLLGALDAPAVLGRAGRRPGHRRQRRQLGGPRRARPRAASRLRLPVPRRGPRLRGASATARSGAATPGLAGEIAHVVTVGPGGVAMRLTDVFAALGLRRPGSTAIDVPALLRAVEPDTEADDAGAGGGRRALGAWSRWPIRRSCWSAGPGAAIRACWRRSRASSRDAPRHVPVEAAAVDDEPALTAARETALQQLRDAVVSRSSRPARR